MSTARAPVAPMASTATAMAACPRLEIAYRIYHLTCVGEPGAQAPCPGRRPSRGPGRAQLCKSCVTGQVTACVTLVTSDSTLCKTYTKATLLGSRRIAGGGAPPDAN